MRQRFRLAFPIVLLGPSLVAQTQSVPLASAPTLSAGTQLVVVDISVQDRAGNPIHGLKQSDFIVSESKSPQLIKTFDEHTAANAATKTPPPLNLPPAPLPTTNPSP